MTAVSLAVTGTLASLDASRRRLLLERSTDQDAAVRERTAAIIAGVRRDGDAALRRLGQTYDGVTLDALAVPRAEWRRALDGLDRAVRRALERSADRIAQAHAAFRPTPQEFETPDGVIIGRRPDPLQRVGVYAPGGRATYPSSLLMGAVPARVAGVDEVIVCSPPAPTGMPSPVLLAAAELAEADGVFRIGGAGAVAAMAFGTESVPRVDRIVGPGNAYVAEAKRQVAGLVAIDSPAGPSELLVIADEGAKADVIAREMLAQAEHDARAAVVAVTTSRRGAAAIVRALGQQLSGQPREATIAEALATRGAVLEARDLDEAIAFAAEYAAEHVFVCTREAEQVAARLRNSGTILVGETSSVAFGDYLTGANHVLPTGGLARAYSGLSTSDFVRWTTWQRVPPRAAAVLAGDVGVLADAEGLPAHAAAARQWATVEAGA